MSDDDLVKRLRDFADDGYADLSIAAAKRIEELEAKLAEAVEALKSIAYESVEEEGIYIAIYALFEIEGEKE